RDSFLPPSAVFGPAIRGRLYAQQDRDGVPRDRPPGPGRELGHGFLSAAMHAAARLPPRPQRANDCLMRRSVTIVHPNRPVNRGFRGIGRKPSASYRRQRSWGSEAYPAPGTRGSPGPARVPGASLGGLLTRTGGEPDGVDPGG